MYNRYVDGLATFTPVTRGPTTRWVSAWRRRICPAYPDRSPRRAATAMTASGSPHLDARRCRLGACCDRRWCAAPRPGPPQDPTGAIEGAITDSPAAESQRRMVPEPPDRLHETGRFGAGWLLPAAPAANRRVQREVSAPQFRTLFSSRHRQREPGRPRQRATGAAGGHRDGDRRRRRSAGRHHQQRTGAGRHGPRAVDLPLNGRNFTQLGLLQTGVAPLTAGVATAGGSLRQGQAYAVNGMRPEQNMYLVDGAQNMNRMDGGYALKLPVDAIAEFRILTQSAPPEYGGTGGATTSVVTRSGGNQFHGNLYEFVRNDAFDATELLLGEGRAAQAEPVRRHDRRSAGERPHDVLRLLRGVPQRPGNHDQRDGADAQERQGDFSDLGMPLLNLAAGGVPFPGNRIPEAAINPGRAQRVEHVSARQRLAVHLSGDVCGRNDSDQAGGRVDCQRLIDRSAVRALLVSRAATTSIPISVRGTDVPGFPTRDDFATHAATASSTHIFSPSLTNSLRGRFLRHMFFFDQRLNQTPPSALGFGYASSNEAGQGPPFFNISGYTPIGGAITGPRNSTQNTFEIQDGAVLDAGRAPDEGRRRSSGTRRSTCSRRSRPNAFFVFAGTFPTNNAVANLLLGAPVTFYQGLGDFGRDVSVWGARRLRAGRVAGRRTADVELRPSLRAHQSDHRGAEPAERLHPRRAVDRVRPEAPSGWCFRVTRASAGASRKSANA